MRIARGIAAVMCACVAVIGLNGCSGDEEQPSDDTTTSAAPTSVTNLTDIPGAVLVIEPDSSGAPATYRTAKITSAMPSGNGESVAVNYETGPDICSMFTGYAVHETDDEVQVTVIVGEQNDCTGKDTLRTTVLNVDKPVGDREVVVSPYSQASVPIENPAK